MSEAHKVYNTIKGSAVSYMILLPELFSYAVYLLGAVFIFFSARALYKSIQNKKSGKLTVDKIKVSMLFLYGLVICMIPMVIGSFFQYFNGRGRSVGCNVLQQ